MGLRDLFELGGKAALHLTRRRIGGDTDLQGAAAYLASDASRQVTGQYRAVDGGASST